MPKKIPAVHPVRIYKICMDVHVIHFIHRKPPSEKVYQHSVFSSRTDNIFSSCLRLSLVNYMNGEDFLIQHQQNMSLKVIAFLKSCLGAKTE